MIKLSARDIIKDVGIILLIAAVLYLLLRKEKVQDQPNVITQKEVEVVDNSKDLKKIIAQRDSLLNAQFKKSDQIKTYVKVKEVFRVDTLKIFYSDTVVKYDTIKKIDYKSFAYKDSSFFISGKTTEKYVQIDSLEVKNEISLAVIKRKGGLFKKRKYTVIAVSKDPRVKLTGLTSVTIEDKSRLGSYLGFGAGVLIK